MDLLVDEDITEFNDKEKKNGCSAGKYVWKVLRGASEDNLAERGETNGVICAYPLTSNPLIKPHCTEVSKSINRDNVEETLACNGEDEYLQGWAKKNPNIFSLTCC